MAFRPELPAKAFAPTDFTVLGTTTLFSPLFAKALSPMAETFLPFSVEGMVRSVPLPLYAVIVTVPSAFSSVVNSLGLVTFTVWVGHFTPSARASV